jgi:hypothetical protein
VADLTPGRYQGDPAVWDAFVEESNNGTVFHRLGFLAYHGDRFAARAHPIAWTKGDALHAVMPLALFPEDGGLVARSPFGASYGGIAVREGLSLQRAGELVGSLPEYLRAQGATKLVVTPPPKLCFARADDYLEFQLLRIGATCVRSELTSYIPVEEEPLEGFRHSAVKAVRKAIAHDVRVEESDDVDTFYDILTENRGRFGAVPTHSRDEIRWLLENLPDHIKLFLARRDGAAIAGSLVFRVNRRAILDFYWAHLEEHQGLRPVSLLVYEITRWARRNGFAWFDFGTQTVDMVPREGSTRFKETFGAVGAFRSTYELALK